MAPTISIIAAGAMGSAVARKLTQAGCTVLTNLDGRSQRTRDQAKAATMQDVSFHEILQRSDWILSILPPSEVSGLAQKISEGYKSHTYSATRGTVGFVDCNAVNPESVKKSAALFKDSGVGFIDAVIIGWPPNDEYNPTFYASAQAADAKLLEQFVDLSRYGLKIRPLIGDGAGVGDASALKMSYAGIVKGVTGLLTTMILAAHRSSPATASALLHELKASQPMLVEKLIRSIPDMIPKAYRWVGEMEEISGFVGDSEGEIHMGLANMFRRVDGSIEQGEEGDVGVLSRFLAEAKAT